MNKHLRFATRLSVICILVPAASASVITQAAVLDNLVGSNYTIGYNWPMLGVGYRASGGCPAVTGGATCVLSPSGTTDTSGNATSSFDSVSVSTHTPAVVNPTISAYDDQASAYAAANLADASVHVSDSGNYLDYRFPNSGQNGGSGTSFAQANDTLNFIVNGATASTVTLITVKFTVDGNVTVPTPAGDSSGMLQSILNFGGANEETDVNSYVQTSYTPVLGTTSANGWVSESVTGTPGLFVFTGTYALTGATNSLGIAETLSESCGLGTSCDYSNTGKVSFTLPSNVSFTSNSGVFLMQTAASSAPEPSTWLTIAGGFALLPFARRLRKA